MFFSGLILFFGIHLIPLFPFRSELKNRLGEAIYMSAFSLLALCGFILIILGYENAQNNLYQISMIFYINAKYIMFVALTISFAPFTGGYIKKYTRHPMSLGISIWAAQHLLTNSDTTSVFLFGAFLCYSILSIIVAELRENNDIEIKPRAYQDGISLFLGLVTTILIYNFHYYFSGVSLV